MRFLVNDEEVISVSHAKVVNQNPTSNTVWEEKLSWFKEYRTLDN